MGDRYQKSIKQDGGSRSGHPKSGIGLRWASIRTRLGIGPGGEKRTFNMPDMGSGHQTHGGYADGDDGRIVRQRPGSGFNPATGTYAMRNSEPPRRRSLWPWILLSFAAIVLLSFAFSPRDDKNTAPSASPPVVAALANTSRPTNALQQNVAATNTPVPTPRPSPTPTPAPSPTPTPEKGSTVLKYGSKGEAVKILQSHLIALGYIALGKDDGAFGDLTLGAVQSFQKENGLVADGIAGEKTLTLLASGTAKEDPDVFVWVEDKGKVYHSDKDCSNMTDPKQIKLSQAEKRKLTLCGNCP